MPLLRQDYPTRVRLNRLRSRVAGHGKHFGFSTTRDLSYLQQFLKRCLFRKFWNQIPHSVGCAQQFLKLGCIQWCREFQKFSDEILFVWDCVLVNPFPTPGNRTCTDITFLGFNLILDLRSRTKTFVSELRRLWNPHQKPKCHRSKWARIGAQDLPKLLTSLIEKMCFIC